MGHKIILVNIDDWEVLYVDGNIYIEGHRITKQELVKAMKDYSTFNVEFKFLNDIGANWVEDNAGFPGHINDIPTSYWSQNG